MLGPKIRLQPEGSEMAEVNHRTVAIVDDDDAVRDSLRFLLEVIGHPVETFASAGEFLKAEVHRLACLILDHHMPEMTGLELAERMRADGAGIPILLITGAPSPAIVTRAAEVGINWVLEKPATEEDLLHFIDASALSVGVS
jgi:two-component system, LuxR family, response regulator FixJ